MPHTMRLLNSLMRNRLSNPKKKIVKKVRSEKMFNIDYSSSNFRVLKPGQSHQEYMLEYYEKHGIGGDK